MQIHQPPIEIVVLVAPFVLHSAPPKVFLPLAPYGVRGSGSVKGALFACGKGKSSQPEVLFHGCGPTRCLLSRHLSSAYRFLFVPAFWRACISHGLSTFLPVFVPGVCVRWLIAFYTIPTLPGLNIFESMGPLSHSNEDMLLGMCAIC